MVASKCDHSQHSGYDEMCNLKTQISRPECLPLLFSRIENPLIRNTNTILLARFARCRVFFLFVHRPSCFHQGIYYGLPGYLTLFCLCWKSHPQSHNCPLVRDTIQCETNYPLSRTVGSIFSINTDFSTCISNFCHFSHFCGPYL